MSNRCGREAPDARALAATASYLTDVARAHREEWMRYGDAASFERWGAYQDAAQFFHGLLAAPGPPGPSPPPGGPGKPRAGSAGSGRRPPVR